MRVAWRGHRWQSLPQIRFTIIPLCVHTPCRDYTACRALSRKGSSALRKGLPKKGYTTARHSGQTARSRATVSASTQVHGCAEHVAWLLSSAPAELSTTPLPFVPPVAYSSPSAPQQAPTPPRSAPISFTLHLSQWQMHLHCRRMMCAHRREICRARPLHTESHGLTSAC